MHAYLVRNDTSVRHDPVADHGMPGHPRLADAWKRFAAALNGMLPVLALTGAGQYWRLGFCGPTPAMLSRVRGELGHRASENRLGLTGRERQVLALLARGASNRAMATTFVVSERTVEYHVGNLLAKLGAANRTEAATWALENGFGAPGDRSP